ncbi:right-handed parallel beta-helix repeat-containing protein [Niabella sp. CC-SYL272]|uniref:right-handed parallel beta-helix repeat-containing protein n=1 Tax=Niabella agricola TaxID=2891571 RepID=UPI001F194038|nr:right-handed parallel beta-helix repeat-containing protein [Niabella agricola]MCF3111205.1 right-handed parallel beta-helix repeat-containing protein [Niabella agricola]
MRNLLKLFSAAMMIIACHGAGAQTIFVDPVKGDDQSPGTSDAPFASLEKAALAAAALPGNAAITIKLAPGLYLLKNKVTVATGKAYGFGARFTIEATVMPDDTAWTPEKMPVIQSVSGNNNDPNRKFPHCVGLLIAANNVVIQGLKFTGNAHPGVNYYYPVKKEDTLYSGLKVAQCYFVGDKNVAPIQGALWAHGSRTEVEHCIFYGCKNALLLFRGIKDFSLTHSIIYGAYEAAVWFGPFTDDFSFRDNVVSNCNFFWLRPEDTYPEYTFSNSIIANNKNYTGVYRTAGGLAPIDKNNFKENHIRKKASVVLNEVEMDGMQKGYLNLSPKSDGYDIAAGIFSSRTKKHESESRE